jgi:DNA-binding TFAR19-related protein (PDSD5 family)
MTTDIDAQVLHEALSRPQRTPTARRQAEAAKRRAIAAAMIEAGYQAMLERPLSPEVRRRLALVRDRLNLAIDAT